MGINVDISKAKNIHKNELRIKRREKFEALDVLYMKALEANEDTTSIKNKKQHANIISNNILLLLVILLKKFLYILHHK